MSNWVIASNPATYNAEGSLQTNNQMDWVTSNKFAIGDVVYVYEVIPPRGRGGIVYKLEVVADDITMATKIDDRRFWAGGVYPKDLESFPRIFRLKLIGGAEDGVIPLSKLKKRRFTAPQGLANSLDAHPALIEYIEDFMYEFKEEEATTNSRRNRRDYYRHSTYNQPERVRKQREKIFTDK